MAKPYGKDTHTQECISVYVSFEEKMEIKKAAGRKGMSKYLLDLHKDRRKEDKNAVISDSG